MSHDPGHPAAVRDRWSVGGGAPRSAVSWARTVVSGVAGVATAAVLGFACVLGVAAVHVTSPDHPGRVLAALMSVPELRAEAADELVVDVEDQLGQPFAPETHHLLAAATEDVLGSPDVTGVLADLRQDEGRIDPAGFLDAVARSLDERAAGSDDPEVARVLREFAVAVDETTLDDTESDVTDLPAIVRMLRGVLLVAAGACVVAALAGWGICVGVARRRGMAAAAVLSGALVLAALVLSTDVRLLRHAPRVVAVPGHVAAAAGQLAGAGTVWTLLAASLVPPAVWLAARSYQRDRSTITS